MKEISFSQFIRGKNLLTGIMLVVILSATAFFYVDRMAAIFDPEDKTFILGWDDSFYFFWLRSSVIDGDVDFRNEIAEHNGLPQEYKDLALAQPRTERDLIPNKFPVGWAVSSAPFYLVAHAFANFASSLGFSISADGYSLPYQLALYFGHGFIAILSLIIAYKILRNFLEMRPALFGLIAGWSGSFLLAYQTRFLSMSHNLVFFYFCCSWYLSIRFSKGKVSTASVLAFGAAAGMLLITRPQTAVYLIVPLGIILNACIKQKLQVQKLLYALIPFSLILTIQLFAWKGLYGSWLLYTYSGEGFNWASPAIIDILFSNHNGLFWWHPLLLIGGCGLFLMGRKQILVFTLISAATLSTLYINASWHCWWYGASFGNRSFEASILFFMLGLGLMHQYLTNRPAVRRVFVSLVSVLVLWNLNLLLLVRYWKHTGIALGEPTNLKSILTSSLEFWSRLF